LWCLLELINCSSFFSDHVSVCVLHFCINQFYGYFCFCSESC
jgi:hypothetical protein